MPFVNLHLFMKYDFICAYLSFVWFVWLSHTPSFALFFCFCFFSLVISLSSMGIDSNKSSNESFLHRPRVMKSFSFCVPFIEVCVFLLFFAEVFCGVYCLSILMGEYRWQAIYHLFSHRPWELPECLFHCHHLLFGLHFSCPRPMESINLKIKITFRFIKITSQQLISVKCW